MISRNLGKKSFSLLMLAFLSLVLAQTALAQNQKELEEALEEFRLAFINPDESTLSRLTSKDLTYGHSSGVIENQAEFIEALVNGTTKYLTLATNDQTIHFVDNIALVRQNFLADIKNGEKLSKLDLGVLLIWKKEKSGWQLLARQGFKR
jgi:hypothetical protein